VEKVLMGAKLLFVAVAFAFMVAVVALMSLIRRR
jgi:hypothetical protein